MQGKQWHHLVAPEAGAKVEVVELEMLLPKQVADWPVEVQKLL